jgi:hypothetical protein
VSRRWTGAEDGYSEWLMGFVVPTVVLSGGLPASDAGGRGDLGVFLSSD